MTPTKKEAAKTTGSIPLDIAALKKKAEEERKNAPQGDYEKKPLLFVKKPDGTTNSAYRVKIDGESKSRGIRTFVGHESQIEHTCIDVVVLDVVNDSEAPAKGPATMVLKSVLLSKLKQAAGSDTNDVSSIFGKVFDVMNVGKPKGKRYFDFILVPAEQTMHIATVFGSLGSDA